MNLWRVVDTWNGGKGGRTVRFTSTETGNAGYNQCFEWIHNNTSFSVSEATTNQGYLIEEFEEEPVLRTYRVVWQIELDAESVVEAARLALEVHRDPTSIATEFEVTSPDGVTTRVDLSQL